MQPVGPATKIVHIEAANPEQNLTNYLTEGKAEPNLVAKRAHYEAAFQIAKGRPADKLLFQLFEQYATETCYGQTGADGDQDEGFRKAAALMELSAVMQLTDVKTGWNEAPSLEALIGSLGYTRGQNGKYFETFLQLTFHPEPNPLLADTLIRLSYSYQNIDELIDAPPTFFSLHKKMTDLTFAVIGDDLQKKEDFAYNRARHMVVQQNLGDKDKDALITCFEPVLELAKVAYKDEPHKLARRFGQVENMRGMHYLSTDPDKAETHFRSAIALYLPVLGKYSSEKDNFDTAFLLSNARSNLTKCLINKPSQERVEELKTLLLELKKFYQVLREQNNNHSYYQDEQKVDALLTQLGVKL